MPAKEFNPANDSDQATTSRVRQLARATTTASAVAVKGTIELLTSSNRGLDMQRQHDEQASRKESEVQRVDTLMWLLEMSRDHATEDGTLNLDAMSQAGWNEFVCGAATVWLLERYSSEQADAIVARSGARIGDRIVEDEMVIDIAGYERSSTHTPNSSV